MFRQKDERHSCRTSPNEPASECDAAVDVLLEPPPHLVPCAGGELDDVECVEDGAGVVESVVDGVLVPVERVQGRDLGVAPKDTLASPP